MSFRPRIISGLSGNNFRVIPGFLHVSRKAAFCSLLFASFLEVQAQKDYDWWNEKHDWDGSTHWTQYLVMSPGFLGPNALPVPDFYAAEVPLPHQLSMGIEGHYSRGDQTHNSFMEYLFPLFSDRASLQIQYRTIEVYQTDTVTRDRRKSRDYETSGYSLGDVYIGTYVQLVRNHAWMPDVLLSANIKTASGTNLEAARHTDTPGYWFDATLGRGLSFFGPGRLRLYARGGFYVYQKLKFNEYQNDAILYGFGVQAKIRSLRMDHQLTGYHGYFDNGDRPMVYRFRLTGAISERLQYGFVFQQGLHDFGFTSVRLTMGYNFTP